MILNPDQLTILAQAAPQTAPQNAPGIGGMLFPLVLMMVMFYFLLIRPQTKREKERKKMVEALKNGGFGGHPRRHRRLRPVGEERHPHHPVSRKQI